MSLTTSSDYTSTFHGRHRCGFALNCSPIARDALVAEAGLDLALSASASIGLTWNGQFANGARNNAVKANVTWRF